MYTHTVCACACVYMHVCVCVCLLTIGEQLQIIDYCCTQLETIIQHYLCSGAIKVTYSYYSYI